MATSYDDSTSNLSNDTREHIREDLQDPQKLFCGWVCISIQIYVAAAFVIVTVLCCYVFKRFLESFKDEPLELEFQQPSKLESPENDYTSLELRFVDAGLM